MPLHIKMLTLQMEKAIHYYIMWQTDKETNVFIHKTINNYGKLQRIGLGEHT